MISLRRIVYLLIYTAAVTALLLFQWDQYANTISLESKEAAIFSAEAVVALVTGTQKLFFVQSLCFVELLNLLKIPYKNVMTAVRYSRQLTLSVICRSLIISLAYSIFVFATLLVISLMGGNLPVFDFAKEIVKIFFFCLYCTFTYYVIYFTIGNFYLSAVLTALINFMLMSFALSANYFGRNSIIYDMLSSFYILIPMCVLSILLWIFYARRRDCL